MLKTIKKAHAAVKQHKLDNEAITVYNQILRAENASSLKECAEYLRLFLATVKSSKQKDIYEPADAQNILVEKVYQLANQNSHPFKQRLEDLVLNNNQGILNEFLIDGEKLAQQLFTQKGKQYMDSLLEVISQMEKTLETGENNISLINQYETIKRELGYHLKDGQEAKPIVTQQVGEELQEIDLDSVAYGNAIQISLNNLSHFLEGLDPREIAADGFLNHHQEIITLLPVYAKKANLDDPLKEKLKGDIENLQQKLGQTIDSVRPEIEKEQDDLYFQLERIAENPSQYDEAVLDRVFEEFKEHSLKYQTVLDDSPEDLIKMYEHLQELREQAEEEQAQEDVLVEYVSPIDHDRFKNGVAKLNNHRKLFFGGNFGIENFKVYELPKEEK